MDKRDAEIIVRLAKEGKQISKIWEEDFPEYDYLDIYWEVYGAGKRSALGTKRMIINRLHKLTTVPKREQYEPTENLFFRSQHD
ncbi:hypothetical protein [Aneurinibacillus sp. UBA3580]|jgi:hypothetical protein|uniref:hypothetical protein n=1 Tax=Aneurinibacillus sp. UBA3580 TaxID=1946041 RepID=UPI00257DB43A|nr:hypothetical protein [Aneurinibacillus sp. UBA3580]